MIDRTSFFLAFLTAVLLSCALAAADPPTDGQPGDEPADGTPPRHNIGPNVRRLPGPGQPSAGRLTADQEDELLAFLQEHRPDRYEPMVALADENPRRYRFVMSRMWAWYQQWKDMSPQAQEAAIAEHDLRMEAYLILRQWRREEDPAAKEQLEARLLETLNRHFDVEQSLREIQLRELEERIEEVRQELQHRQEDREAIVQEYLDRMLQYHPRQPDEGARDGSSPAGPGAGPHHHQPTQPPPAEHPPDDAD